MPDYLLMPRAELLALPTTGPAWTAMKAVADSNWGSPDLTDQNCKHGVKALAGALVYARTGTQSYYHKTAAGIASAVGTERDNCSQLSISRQLGSYVLAADLLDLAVEDRATFSDWLDTMRTRRFTFHGRWQVLTATHEDSNNNWGSFAGASRIAASLYLGDTADVAKAANVLRGFLGNYEAWDDFRSPLYPLEAVWACRSDANGAIYYTPINRSCTKDGINLNGAIVGDVFRDDKGLTWPVGPTGIGYTLESLQGLILQTELLYRNGYSGGNLGAWGWSQSALKRAAALVTRNGKAGGPSWNYSSVSYHVPWLLNRRYGLKLPTKPAGYGRTLGFTDWLYGPR